LNELIKEKESPADISAGLFLCRFPCPVFSNLQAWGQLSFNSIIFANNFESPRYLKNLPAE
jgi:hypothetical protein